MTDSSPPTTETPRVAEQAERWVTARLSHAGFHTVIEARDHSFAADEPVASGGSDLAATPYELLLASLGACTAMTLRMYATRKGWALDRVTVRLRPARDHAVDCVNCESLPVDVGALEREIEIVGTLTPEQRLRLLAIADRCPVKQTLERGIRIVAAGGAPASPPIAISPLEDAP